jgi:hypothetical protein
MKFLTTPEFVFMFFFPTLNLAFVKKGVSPSNENSTCYCIHCLRPTTPTQLFLKEYFRKYVLPIDILFKCYIDCV